MKKKVLIVGGGASGMVAAITAARNGADVVILEQKDALGKKILATGNGRCNFTNLSMNEEAYYCQHKDFMRNLLSVYTPQMILTFFESIGILHKERNGYVYPFTDQASSMRDALVSELTILGVTIHVDTIVTEVLMAKDSQQARGRYTVRTNSKTFYCDTLILATGGKSGLGKPGRDGYALISNTRHALTPLSPALVPLKGQGKFYKKIAGIRTDATVTAMIDNQMLRSDTGEIQLTDYGISGIPVFQISRLLTQALATNPTANLSVQIDFMPTYTQDQLAQLFLMRKAQFETRSMKIFMNGIFKDKLADFVLYTARIDCDALVSNITSKELQKLARICKTFAVRINGSKDFAQSQVTAGGVPIHEITNHFESIYHPQLYFIGEVLDVDGICGGYNLHFAWASGMLAGTHCTSNPQ